VRQSARSASVPLCQRMDRRKATHGNEKLGDTNNK
jgi:hypothetical protein